MIAFTRMKDWLKLLGLELEQGSFGCYRPPFSSERWLSRHAFMELAGARWWPVFGAVYCVTAIKRAHGMRLVGPLKVKKPILAPRLNVPVTPSANSLTSLNTTPSLPVSTSSSSIKHS